MTNTPSAKTRQELLDANYLELDAQTLDALSAKQNNLELAHNIRLMADTFRAKAVQLRAAAEKGEYGDEAYRG